MWSYTFTDYNHFTSPTNAVAPRPNWPVGPGANVLISTTPPLNETDYNAMNFSQWKQLGRQVLIKSNINNWLSCQSGSGSLVDWQVGSVSCQIVNHVTETCNGAPAPSMFTPELAFGPVFYSPVHIPGHYYYFDGSTVYYWPTHDPCGTNEENNLKHVTNPHGNIYIR